MPVRPSIGTVGGQHYDLARAIQTFLQQMAEGSQNVVPAVIKELLQNADDAGATEMFVILDERKPPPGLPPEYQILYWPSLLIRNNAHFRLSEEVNEGEKDDFSALCDVASGHKRSQAIAAGRFGIGFNSVYFLTDTPLLFSRREVHIFDVLHHLFPENGWRFGVEDFPAASGLSVGPIKSTLEWVFPKEALGDGASFGKLAMDPQSDYTQTLFRLPLRQVPAEGRRNLYQDTFPKPEDRYRALEDAFRQSTKSLIFLKNIRSVVFAYLRDGPDGRVQEEVGRVEISQNPPEFHEFLKTVERLSTNLNSSEKVAPCAFDRSVWWRWTGSVDARNHEEEWSFRLIHAVSFDNEELRDLRIRLAKNEEKAIPWVSIAVPKNSESLKFDGPDHPTWRVFLPLTEPGPSGCVFSAALFVGPSRQKSEFRTDGSDEALRKTKWNKALVEKALVPLLADASSDLPDNIADFVLEDPKGYLSIFPRATKRARDGSNLSEYFQNCFNDHPWLLKLPDIWGTAFDILMGDPNSRLCLEMVPKWMLAYKENISHLSSEDRRFIHKNSGEALKLRLTPGSPITVLPPQKDVVTLILRGNDISPRPGDLGLLLKAMSPDGKLDSADIEGLLCFQDATQQSLLIRYHKENVYLLGTEARAEIHQHLDRLQLTFDGVFRVDPHIGLAGLEPEKRRDLTNILPLDETGALVLLRRVGSEHGHDAITNPHRIVPIVDFLCNTDSSSLTLDLRLSFLVRTAHNQHLRRSAGVILIPPAYIECSPQDRDYWEVFLHGVFPEVDPEFATQLVRLLEHSPHILPCLSNADCRVTLGRTENTLQLLVFACKRDDATTKRLKRTINLAAKESPGRVERVVSSLIAQADRQWDSLKEDDRNTILALPIHRRADGTYKGLTGNGIYPQEVGYWYRIQSDEDLRDAPIEMHEVQLLQTLDQSVKSFYRTRLKIKEQGRVEVLKQVLTEIGLPDAANERLLDYLYQHYHETVDRLERSDQQFDKDDAAELKSLFREAKSIPCTDGEWRNAGECLDGGDIADRLSQQKWNAEELDDLLGKLFFEDFIAKTNRKILKITRRLHDLPRLEAALLAGKAITSESPDFDLKGRLKILIDNQESLSVRSLSPARILREFLVPTVAGEKAIAHVEYVPSESENRFPWLLGLLAPHRLSLERFAARFGIPLDHLEEIVKILQIHEVTMEELDRRLAARFQSIWLGLEHTDRIRLLEHIGKRRLAEDFRDMANTLESVLVTEGRKWVVPRDVVAPSLLASEPPLLGAVQLPFVRENNPYLQNVWNSWCGINTLEKLVVKVCDAALKLPVEQSAGGASKLGRWLNRLLENESDSSHVLRNALKEIPWVLAECGLEVEFKKPSEVIQHKAKDVLRHEFWVTNTSLPKEVLKDLVNWGFLTGLDTNQVTLEKLGRCLAKSTASEEGAVLSAYRLAAGILQTDPGLWNSWYEISSQIPLFRTFRNPERSVTAAQLFLGNDKYAQDFGELLFCLKLRDELPKGVEKLYRDLGIEESPTPFQILTAMASLDGKTRQVRQIHSQLLKALRTYKDVDFEDESLANCRVRDCSGDYRTLEECFWDEELGHPKHITLASQVKLIDTADPATRDFCRWIKETHPSLLRDLRDHAQPKPGEITCADSLAPTASQVLGPWDDWVNELTRDGSRIREEIMGRGLEAPIEPFRIVPVERVSVSYILENGVEIALADPWEGPTVSHDGRSRILARRRDVERDYLEDGPALETFDRKMAECLACLLGARRSIESNKPEEIITLILKDLDRPSVALERMRDTQAKHFLHQYHDQVADPDFAVLFEEYQKTSDRSQRYGLLYEQMWSILREKYVAARQDQIRGYGYDELSVFAELVQNAEDAYLQRKQLGMDAPDKPLVRFAYRLGEESSKCLIFEHFGRPFNHWRHGSREEKRFSRDVQGVLRSAGSFKPGSSEHDATNQPIGRFGLGFKSVYLLTDRPCIHSGAWHFEIQAGCLPKQKKPPEDLAKEATRIELPLRSDNNSEFIDSTGQQLIRIIPFLREINTIELSNSEGSKPLILDVHVTSVAHQAEDGSYVEVVEISGISFLRTGKARFLRIRHSNHSGQLGIYLGQDGLPSHWDEAFSADLYAVLPLKARLGCGIAVSNLFEVQSGRTHLVDMVKNEPRFEETARLVSAVPVAFDLITTDTIAIDEVLRQFWSLWHWDLGDEETRPARKALAKEVALLPLRTPMVPTELAGHTVQLGIDTIFYFSRVPDAIEDILIAEGALIFRSDSEKPVELKSENVTQEIFAVGYLRACKYGGIDPSEKLVRLDWKAIGDSFKATDILAHKPRLLSAIAEKLDERHRQSVLEWLPDCSVAGSDGAGKVIQDKPRRFLREDFPGKAHLPKRLLGLISSDYSKAAQDVLLDAGLRPCPSGKEIQDWISNRVLTAEECKGLLRYLAEDKRWMDETYRHLDSIFRSAWFPHGSDYLSSAKAFERKLIKEDDLWDAQFKAWLGVLLVALPDMTRGREPHPIDLQEALNRLYDWWQENRVSETRKYEERTYPRGKPPEIRGQFLEMDRYERKQWLSLFMLGSFHTLGRVTLEQNRNFLSMCHHKNWMDVFVAPTMEANRWIGILENYMEQQTDESQYYMWVLQFVRIFQLARRLEEHVELFLSINRFDEPFPLSDVTAPRSSSRHDRGGIDPPPITRTLGLGIHFVIRELVRRRILNTPFANRYCYVPNLSVRKLLSDLGCDRFSEGLGGGPESSVAIYNLLIEHLGEKRATFGHSFDLPLIAMASNPAVREKICRAR